jgi:hypothetical protein
LKAIQRHGPRAQAECLIAAKCRHLEVAIGFGQIAGEGLGAVSRKKSGKCALAR